MITLIQLEQLRALCPFANAELTVRLSDEELFFGWSVVVEGVVHTFSRRICLRVLAQSHADLIDYAFIKTRLHFANLKWELEESEL